MLLWLLACTTCAQKAAQPPEGTEALPFPEVTKLFFQGNHTLSNGELRKVIATTPRPAFPPWRHGEPYNLPTLEADVRRLKKYYFDRGFLDTMVRLGNIREQREENAVQIEILIDEGAPTAVAAVQIAGTIPP